MLLYFYPKNYLGDWAQYRIKIAQWQTVSPKPWLGLCTKLISFSNTRSLGRKLVENNFPLFSHLDIAMPCDDRTGGTQGSSFGKTHVTVYHCNDCESNTCESSNYEDFVKIGETQCEKFSNETIQLVTSETYIIMCFQQENTFPEGLYAIVWERAMGVGDSCGILNYGGMLYWEPGYQHMENIFLVMKPSCYIFGQTVRLVSKLTCQNEFLLWKKSLSQSQK